MARRGYRTEQQYPLMILDLLSYDPPGSTWTGIWKRAKERGIGREAFCRHLEKLVQTRRVLHEGKFYRRNPTHRTGYDYMRNVLAGKPGSLPIEQRLQSIYSWTSDANHRKFVEALNWKTEQDALTRIELEFMRAFEQFMLILHDVVKIPNKTSARSTLISPLRWRSNPFCLI